jgi:hypothetical protein
MAAPVATDIGASGCPAANVPWHPRHRNRECHSPRVHSHGVACLCKQPLTQTLCSLSFSGVSFNNLVSYVTENTRRHHCKARLFSVVYMSNQNAARIRGHLQSLRSSYRGNGAEPSTGCSRHMAAYVSVRLQPFPTKVIASLYVLIILPSHALHSPAVKTSNLT